MRISVIQPHNLTRNTNQPQKNNNTPHNTVSFGVLFPKKSFETLYNEVEETTSIFQKAIKKITEPKVDGRKFHLISLPHTIEMETPEKTINGATTSIYYIRDTKKNLNGILYLTSTKNNKTDYIDIQTNSKKMADVKNIEINYQKANWDKKDSKKTFASLLHPEHVMLTEKTHFVTKEVNETIKTIKEILTAFINKEKN